MSEKKTIQEIMGISMDKLHEMVDVNTIIGDPINSPDGTVVIPVSKVSFGFVSGGSDLPTQSPEKFAGGSGAGVTVKPQAFIIIKKDGDVKLLEMGAAAPSPVDSVIDALPGLIDKIKTFIEEKKSKDAEISENKE